MVERDLSAQLEKMQREWDERARENARFYVDTARQDWTDADFFRSGEGTVSEEILTDMINICQGKDPKRMRVLEIGCGAGRVTRALARIFGEVYAVDISGEMVRQARAASKEFENVMFVQGSAAQIPWEENYFDKVLSVESFYYYPDQDRALAELFRVMAPRGRLYILINLYKDNEYSLQWVPKLKVPVQVRSAAEYVELLKAHAFEKVEWAQIPDDTPTPENYQTTSFRSLDDMKAFKRVGALLLMASKPDVRNPAPGWTIY